MSDPPFDLELIATAAFGLEAVVVRELKALGYPGRTVRPGRVLFHGDRQAICRTNLWLRSAERVLVRMGTFPAADFDQLFEGVRAIDWQEWIPADAELPVRGRSRKSRLTSVPACQRTVKKALVEKLLCAHRVDQLPESGPICAVEVELLDDNATLTLDTSGVGLHKRGYRTRVGGAPLRETLAAALVALSFWRPERPLIDPFCGTGTIPIEAALIGRRIAPGLRRTFAAEDWPTLAASLWREAREEARSLIEPPLPCRILGTDVHRSPLHFARQHARQAGVDDAIDFRQIAFDQVRSERPYGCLITNPPYGRRMGQAEEMETLYRSIPHVLRRFPTWSHYLLTARPDFEALVGQPADRRRKLYNGRIACTYFQFHGPRPPVQRPPEVAHQPDVPHGPEVAHGPDAPPAGEGGRLPAGAGPTAEHATERAPVRVEVADRPVFGGLRSEAARQVEEFSNRLRKRARHLRRWPTKRGITCYRLYDRDVPEVPLVIDRYADLLHIAEYDRPHDRTPAEHADWIDLMLETTRRVLDVPRGNIFFKRRERQRGTRQYQHLSARGVTRIVEEAGLRFRINLTDYLDTGLFLDHRITRGMVRDLARGKRVLNLFAYTGAFSVYAAAGGAATTTSVDLLPTHLDWARDNLAINGFQTGGAHRFVRADARDYLAHLPPASRFDLAVVDPPTFSNSKRADGDWDVQRDYAGLLNQVASHLSAGGILFFSTNYRRFRLDETALVDLAVHEISRRTVPEDFRNRRIHRCWKLVRRGVGDK